MAGFRGNGEGSIYQRSSDGRWLGVVTIGQDGTGRVVRKTVSAKTRAEVVRKLKTLQRQLDDGLPAPDTKMTVAQLLTQWHDDVLRHQVAPSAALSYWTVAKHHIVPTLGSKKLVNLTSADIDRLLSAKLDSGLSISTVCRIRSVLGQAIDQGIRWGSVNRNVVRAHCRPRNNVEKGYGPSILGWRLSAANTAIFGGEHRNYWGRDDHSFQKLFHVIEESPKSTSIQRRIWVRIVSEMLKTSKGL